MRTMQFTEENINEILRLLAGILHTGNIEFVTAGGAQISSKSGSLPFPYTHFTSYGYNERWRANYGPANT